jgi:hypothetical protein
MFIKISGFVVPFKGFSAELTKGTENVGGTISRFKSKNNPIVSQPLPQRWSPSRNISTHKEMINSILSQNKIVAQPR